MNLAGDQFPVAWLWFAAVIAGTLLWKAIRWAPWAWLAAHGRIHLWLGSVVVLMLLWTMNAGTKPGLNLHLLGASAAALVFGPALAMLAVAGGVFAVVLNGDMQWSTTGLNLLVSGALPIAFSHLLRRFVEDRCPPNYFVYIFVQAFLGAAVGIVLVGLVASAAMALAGAYPPAELLEDYLPFFLLLAFSEGWLTGMVMTLLVVYRPEWVASFDDARYLTKKTAERAPAVRHEKSKTGDSTE